MFLGILLPLTFVLRSNAECLPSANTCEFTLELHETMSMYKGRTKVFVANGGLVDKDGNLVSEEGVISADGYEFGKLVIAVNGTIPGPPIEVYRGQTVVVHVMNGLSDRSTSIHWHGIYQKGTPWMDGVSRLTQCPIQAGSAFTYTFVANPVGTHWYHAHSGAQRIDGLYGALVIREPDQNPSLEHVMTVGEYDHLNSADTAYHKMVQGFWPTFGGTSSFDGGHFSKVLNHAVLINGRGRFWEESSGGFNQAPLTIVPVRSGSTYRLRFVNVGSVYPFRLSIDGHALTLVSSDGADLEPVAVESFIFFPGERYDVTISADQPVGNYWIRANTLQVEHPWARHNGLAILRYNEAPAEDPVADPSMTARTCSAGSRCKVANCPFPKFPAEDFTDCLWFARDLKLSSHALARAEYTSAPRADEGSAFQQYFLNFAFPGVSETPGSVNGRALTRLPPGPPLTQTEHREYLSSCTPDDDPKCGPDKVCHCPLTLFLQKNATVELVLMNTGSGEGWAHPIHIHGHHFHVMKMGMLEHEDENGTVIDKTIHKDIRCDADHTANESWDGLHFCNSAHFENETWVGDNIPGLEFLHAPLKDTLTIPRGAYAITRIRANNPGLWFLHCHIEIHAEDGMAMSLSEAMDEWGNNPPPDGFPKCDSFLGGSAENATLHGCTYTQASNYDMSAQVDDGSCTFGDTASTATALRSNLLAVCLIYMLLHLTF